MLGVEAADDQDVMNNDAKTIIQGWSTELEEVRTLRKKIAEYRETLAKITQKMSAIEARCTLMATGSNDGIRKATARIVLEEDNAYQGYCTQEIQLKRQIAEAEADADYHNGYARMLAKLFEVHMENGNI